MGTKRIYIEKRQCREGALLRHLCPIYHVGHLSVFGIIVAGFRLIHRLSIHELPFSTLAPLDRAFLYPQYGLLWNCSGRI